MNPLDNRRILFVDDLTSIHDDFRKILAKDTVGSELEADEAALFGASNGATSVEFEMDSAFQGEEALDKIRASLKTNAPYAMAFIDMRMPPGWDGVETVERLWAEDPRLQVVFCTAYSDYSWKDVLNRLDVRDRLLILKKPFDPIEVYQFANALTTKWKMTEQAAFKMESLEQAVEERTRELSNANIIVQNSPVILYRVRGEPSFPLIYVSHNITKLGHDPKGLVGSPNWAVNLIHVDDRPKVGEAMARILERDAEGASIEFRLCAGDGSLHWVENRYVPVRDHGGRLIEVEGIVIDITERKAAEEKIVLLARTDGLTGLANRSTFIERLHQVFAAAKRGAVPFAILYLDLDRFKPINDTFGHPMGDLLLKEVARRLKSCARETDLVARLGGDEFAVLQCEVKEAANAGELAARIQAELCRPYLLNGTEASISVSIGICTFSTATPDPDAMLAQADVALYRSKNEGRNQYHFHSDDLDREVLERVTLGGELLEAIERDQLELQYQPQVELSSDKIIGMEALVRWNHPTRGLLAPGVFIPIAEKTGAIVPLGHWVLNQACRQMKLWHDEGLAPSVVAVNLSLHQLKQGQALIREVTETLEKWGLPASSLEFDVTEATLAQLKWSQSDVLPQLRALGVKIAIDGFGSEYSSFDYIKEYGVNHLKMAPSYIDERAINADDAAAMRAIMAFARDMGIAVIAQGVETERQSALLRQTDCATHAQGFHFSKPVNAEKAGELLRLGTVRPPQSSHSRHDT
ncbi:MAG TPA: EAL domain-containing protein [Rhizomicrobium sp.]|jgi:diguanylate cyclase (GGDEF)-like protein/PAS domain S-box-containing protein|nr:EAL domain-containing protein [Rhizomicrobium sp.]